MKRLRPPPTWGNLHRMQRLGPLVVLLAVAAVNVPWLTCRSDCHDGSRALWVFFDHHCHAAHEEHEETVHEEAQAGCGDHGHHEHGSPEESADRGTDSGTPDHPQEPGDHEVCYHPVVRADAPALLATPSAALPTWFGEVIPGIGPSIATTRSAVGATGPPPDLASVRLLL